MKNNIIFWALTVLFLIACTVLFFSRNSTKAEISAGAEVTSSANVTLSKEKTPPVNINTADKDKLMLLDGIGEVTADSIIAYREEHGPFLSVEEIMEVSGIGEKKFEAIKDCITVGD